MHGDFTAHCDEQISLVDTLINNLTAERARLVRDQARLKSGDNTIKHRQIEWRLMILDQEVIHLSYRRGYWEGAKARGFATIPVVGHGYRRGAPI